MKQMSSYPVRISRSADIRKTLSATAGIYRKAVDFFISVCMEEWDTVSACKGQTGKVNAVEAFPDPAADVPSRPRPFPSGS